MGIQGVTWGYKGLQAITRGYRRLQGVTGGCKGLLEVTRGYRRLQGVTGVTKNYRNVFLTRTFPDTFSWLILHKNRSWRNLKFFTKLMDLPLLKNSNFAFFIKSLFLWSLKASFLCRTSGNTFSKSIFDKHKIWENFSFLSKFMDYPLWRNASFAFSLNPCLYCLKRLVY